MKTLSFLRKGRKATLAILSLGLTMTACTDKEQLVSPDATEADVYIEDGHLKFKDKQVFDEIIEDLKNNGADGQSRSASRLCGFKSMKVIDDELNLNNPVSRTADDDEIEEGSEDEYRLAMAEDLMKDDVLTYVMDTTLRIGVGDKFYKITDKGTFFGSNEAKDRVLDAALDFNPDKLQHIGNDEYKINDEVGFIDTYGLYSDVNYTEDMEPELVEMDEEDAESRSVPYYNNGQGNTSYYGLATYSWKNNSWWQNFWDKIRGKDVTKENKFNKKLRCQVECFKVNYFFYASTGVKIKCQKRKKIWFVTYWKGTTADEIVMGIEHLKGSMNFSYNPQSTHYLDVFNTTVNGYGTRTLSMVYRGLSKIPILKSWTDRKLTTVFLGEGIRNNVVDFLKYPTSYNIWAATSEQVREEFIFRGLRTLVGKPLKDVSRKVTSKEPKVGLYFPYYGRMDVYVVDGVMSYGRGSSKTIRFSQSGGVSFIVGAGFIGYTPEVFDMRKFSMFGAVRVGNEWKGVRFVN